MLLINRKELMWLRECQHNLYLGQNSLVHILHNSSIFKIPENVRRKGCDAGQGDPFSVFSLQ